MECYGNLQLNSTMEILKQLELAFGHTFEYIKVLLYV